jgi:phosphoribosylformylglycinamidine synthase
MMLLGWVPYKGLAMAKQPRFVRNVAERFQSRWVRVKVMPTVSKLFNDMVGSGIGVWVAHGEGQLVVPEEGMLKQMIAEGLVPLCFVDAEGNPTDAYPFCPNGSPFGATAVCSPDGRHTAMMPHPERAFLSWQAGYVPGKWASHPVGPWLKLFQNAFSFTMEKLEGVAAVA